MYLAKQDVIRTYHALCLQQAVALITCLSTTCNTISYLRKMICISWKIFLLFNKTHIMICYTAFSPAQKIFENIDKLSKIGGIFTS